MNTKLWVPEYDTPELWHTEISRRSFVKTGISSFLGLIAMQHFRLQQSQRSLDDIIPRAKHCIVLFMSGGASQLDTFDPKPGTENGGPFAAIPTSAKVYRSPNIYRMSPSRRTNSLLSVQMVSREGNHERARYLLHTGYAPGGCSTAPYTRVNHLLLS